MMAAQNEGHTRLQMLDLSAVDRDGSRRIGDGTLQKIAVSGAQEQSLLSDSPYNPLMLDAFLFFHTIDLLSRIEMSQSWMVQEYH